MSAVQLGLVILLTTAFMVNEYYLFSGVVVVLYITYTLIRGLYKRIVFYILCICLILFRYQQFRMFDEPTYKEIGFVYQIQNSGYVIKNIKSNQRYLIYTDEALGINDIVEVNGEYKEVTSLRNFNIFNYQHSFRRC